MTYFSSMLLRLELMVCLMINLSFIKLDINIMNDSKIKLIRKMPDGDGMLVLWIGILCLGMKSGRVGTLELGDGIPFTAETLSVELDIPVNTVRLGLNTFKELKMIELWDDGTTFLRNFEKHQNLSKIECAKQKSRESSRNYREKIKIGSDCHDKDSDSTDKEKEIDTDKEEEIDTDKEEEIKIKEKELSEEFTRFWNLYDKKKDKDKCFMKWKKITAKDKLIIFELVKPYVDSTPDKKFRKNPLTYLNGKCWHDEIITTNGQKPGGMKKNGFDKNYYEGQRSTPESDLF
jgi:predicted phage replisome organizer